MKQSSEQGRAAAAQWLENRQHRVKVETGFTLSGRFETQSAFYISEEFLDCHTHRGPVCLCCIQFSLRLEEITL